MEGVRSSELSFLYFAFPLKWGMQNKSHKNNETEFPLTFSFEVVPLFPP